MGKSKFSVDKIVLPFFSIPSVVCGAETSGAGAGESDWASEPSDLSVSDFVSDDVSFSTLSLVTLRGDLAGDSFVLSLFRGLA